MCKLDPTSGPSLNCAKSMRRVRSVVKISTSPSPSPQPIRTGVAETVAVCNAGCSMARQRAVDRLRDARGMKPVLYGGRPELNDSLDLRERFARVVSYEPEGPLVGVEVGVRS
jgi:hypothetical protein